MTDTKSRGETYKSDEGPPPEATRALEYLRATGPVKSGDWAFNGTTIYHQDKIVTWKLDQFAGLQRHLEHQVHYLTGLRELVKEARKEEARYCASVSSLTLNVQKLRVELLDELPRSTDEKVEKLLKEAEAYKVKRSDTGRRKPPGVKAKRC